MAERKPLDRSIRGTLLINACKLFDNLGIELTSEQKTTAENEKKYREKENARAREAWRAKMQIPENREKFNAQKREYYANMSKEAKEKRREQIRVYNRAYRAEHRQEEKERRHEYYIAHREEEQAKARERSATYRANHREEINARERARRLSVTDRAIMALAVIQGILDSGLNEEVISRTVQEYCKAMCEIFKSIASAECVPKYSLLNTDRALIALEVIQRILNSNWTAETKREMIHDHCKAMFAVLNA